MPRRRTFPFAGVTFIQTSRSPTRRRESTKTVIHEAKSEELERGIGAWTDIPYRSGHAPKRPARAAFQNRIVATRRGQLSLSLSLSLSLAIPRERVWWSESSKMMMIMMMRKFMLDECVGGCRCRLRIDIFDHTHQWPIQGKAKKCKRAPLTEHSW